MLARGGRIAIAALAIAACGLDAVGQGASSSGTVTEDAGPLIPADAGYTPPPPEAAPPDGNCGDILTNSQQCGACGHSCGGTACTDGVCTPEPVLSVNDPHAIALAATEAFVASSGNIRRIPFGGAAAEIPGTENALSIAVSDPIVLYVTQKSYALNKPGGGSSISSSRGRDVAFASGRIFVSREAGDVFSREPDLSSGTERPHTTAAGDPFGLAVDDTNVYWVDRTAKAIHKAPHTGAGGPIVPNQDGLSSIATDGLALYWTTTTEIHRSDNAGKDVTVLATNLKDPRSIVVKSSMLYWFDASSGELKRMPTKGGPPLVLARIKPLPADTSTRLIAVNDTHVYWVSPNDNIVARLPR